MDPTTQHQSPPPPTPRGPKRAPGAPVGPLQVRAAVIDAGATLFGEHGVSAVSLRDIAAGANVETALIRRYVGPRHAVIDEVFRSVSSQVVDELEAKPLGQLEFGRQSNLGRWMTMLTYYNVRGIPAPSEGPSPVETLATILDRTSHIGMEAARIRAAQITAISIGWRLFEGHLVTLANIADQPLPALRDDINAIQRLIAGTPWPTPPA